ncbi:MAG TPA: FAD-dependent monooxygenase [Polyangia bacterium]|nr:FAD-dependent monooxygenase [Polyangia bacterium]
MDAEVLVVGAGPTGLILAYLLARMGIRVRIVDQAEGPGETSRALVVQARTLEIYRQLGFAAPVIAAGVKVERVNLWAHGRKAAHLELGELGAIDSPSPFAVVFPQDEHERFLIDRLAEVGVQVERRTKLASFQETADGVTAELAGAGSPPAACRCRFLAGCDGARSTVREQLGLGFPGGTYEHLFYVADVEAGGPLVDGELHVSFAESDFVALFPLTRPGHLRLIGTIRTEQAGAADRLGWDDVSPDLLRQLRVDVRQVNWFSTYRVHHRVAARFRRGRAFLLGDAAHIHSPVGGQGMNTGIGDAVNLAWKLAAALRGRAPPALLDSYEPERIGFARRLVATTDRVFELATRRGPLAAAVRMQIAPPVIGAAFRSRAVRRFLYRTVSQTAIQYRASPLSAGRAGRIAAGDRLPWVAPGPDNFAPLGALGWQAHVYGAAGSSLADACRARGVPLQVFAWSRSAARVGLARDALYLVRPDGYVGFADAPARPAALERYLDAHGLRLVAAG